MKGLRNDLINSNKKVDSLHDQIKEINLIIDEKNIIIENLKENLKAKISELKKKINKHLNEVLILTEENDKLKREITDFR